MLSYEIGETVIMQHKYPDKRDIHSFLLSFSTLCVKHFLQFFYTFSF